MLVLFSRRNVLWSPGRTPEASCPVKGANRTIPGAFLVLFLRLIFQFAKPVEQREKSLFDGHSHFKFHVDCRRKTSLLLV